jgi:hypothetical protein
MIAIINFGEQKGDGKASITREEQQGIAVKPSFFLNDMCSLLN